MPPSFSDELRNSVERLRKRLLDLTGRNPSISFKHSAKTKKQIRVIDEVPDVLFARLLDLGEFEICGVPVPDMDPEDEKTKDFQRTLKNARSTDSIYRKEIEDLGENPNKRETRQAENSLRDRLRLELQMPKIERDQRPPVKEEAEKAGINPSFELPVKRGRAAHTDEYLQTLLYEDELDAMLSTLCQHADLIESETGTAPLYLAFGFLEWYESDNSTKSLHSPLIFLPVEIRKEKDQKKVRYFLNVREPEPTFNLSLNERFKREFHLQIPSISSSDEIKPSEYLKKLSDVITDQKDWKIHNWATISFFSFTKFAMFKELEGENLNKISAQSTPLEDLISGSEGVSEGDIFASDYDIDKEEQNGRIPRIISSADTSQISAIMDVLSGKNLVIEGPPGTGKSQTITNMIAALIEDGKKVLFVAEKKAALTVVKERLTKANLAPFCLELHSAKSKRTEVLNSLKLRMKVKKDRSAENTVEDLERKISNIKSELGKYIGSINQEHEPLNLTVQEILWQFLNIKDKYADLFKELDDSKIEYAEIKKKSDIERIELNLRTLSADFSSHILQFKRYNQHPWFGLISSEKIGPDVAPYTRQIREISKYLNEIKACSSEIGNDFFSKISLKDFDTFFEALPVLEKYAHFDFSWAINLLDKFGIRTKEILSAVIQTKNKIDLEQSTISKFGPGILQNKISALQISSTFEVIRKQGLTKYSLYELDRICTELEVTKQNTESAMSTFTVIVSLLGLKMSSSFTNLKSLYDLCAVLTRCPISKWDLRHSELLFNDLGASEIVKRGRALKETRDKLLVNVNLEVASTLPIKEIVSALNGSNIFSWFFPKYRRAKKVLKTILKNPTEDLFAVKYLLELETYIQSEKVFKSNSDAARVFAEGSFHGVDSDFDGLEAWLKYYQEISKWLKLSELDPQILQKVMSLEKDTILRLRNYGIGAMASADSEGSGRIFLEDRLNEIKNKLKLISEVISSLQSMEVSANFTCGDLEEVVRNVLNLEALQKLMGSGDCQIVLQCCPEFYNIVDRGLVDAFVEVQDASAKFEIPDQRFRLMLSGDFREWCRLAKDASVTVLRCQKKIFEIIESCRAEELGFKKICLVDLQNRVLRAVQNESTAIGYLEFMHSLETVKLEVTEDFLNISLNNSEIAQRLDLAYKYTFFKSLTESFLRENPKLFKSVSSRFEEYRTKFRDLDDRLMIGYQAFISSKLCSRPIAQGISAGRKKDFTDLGLIEHLLTLERPNVSVRELLVRATSAVQSLKPVFLMSPLSVAQLIPQEMKFDVVIMDEASQMKPEDAIGSIARASQVIIVGDPKQMPPSDYFSRSGDDENEAEDEFIEIKQESILDLGISTFKPARRLKWHYRSRNEELIAFSNRHFYDNDLIIFPSAKNLQHAEGVKLEFIQGVYGSGLNRIEAEATVSRAVHLIKERPTCSMMIVAMNQKQSDLINDLFLEREKNDPVLEKYRDHWEDTLEPFRVRNLENVQGDERDLVIISTVYGPDSNNHMFQRFGPIGYEHGHRRLNVLFTRAKELMWIVSSLDDNRIEVSGSSSRGVHAFKNFLNYARTKQLGAEVTTFGERPPDSDFELFVAQKLRQNLPHLEIVAQVGVAGFFIDLAIKHPEKEGAFLLGIECDGKTYHSSKSARDRDKIRQQILEDLGWKLHRIWSTDWFLNSDQEIKKLTAKIESLLAA